jgi:Na+-translocating ferredoxin:NAD+ oxidoreductase subunit C
MANEKEKKPRPVVRKFRKGGVHTAELKFTASSTVEKSNVPRLVRIPMCQHLGAPAKPLVKTGDLVTEGQLIGEAVGTVSANVHASVSGKVVSVEKGNTLKDKGVDHVVIETGGTVRNWYSQKHDHADMTPEQLIAEIRGAGIVGLGGAAFPTHVKLSPPKEKKIDVLILNGAECEPYLTVDHRMMVERTDEVLEGLRIMKKILGVKDVLIGIEENKPDAIEAFNSRPGAGTEFRVEVVKALYPQGGEKQLVQALTGMEVPRNGFPEDVGVIVENVATVYAVYEAVVFKKPLIERSITYSGERVEKRGNYKVRIGMTFREFFEDHGIPAEKVRGTVIAGGPMTGIGIEDMDLAITKGVTGIVVLPKNKDYRIRNLPCIRCSKCLSVCPVRLQPTELAKLCELELFDEAAADFGLMDCIECGACSFVCPSTIPIVNLIRCGKDACRRRPARSAAVK